MNELRSSQTPAPLALLIFTSRIAALVEEGFNFGEIFKILEDTPEPYGSDSKRIRNLIMTEPYSTLSDAMANQPNLYSPFYVFIVRAGEIGGIPEVSFRRASDIIAKEWRLMARWSDREAPVFVAAPHQQAIPENWTRLSPYQRTVIQMLFCDTLGSILGAGVPILRSLDVVRQLLPRAQAERLDEIKESIKAGERFDAARLEMLPAFVVALIARGEEEGTLNVTLLKAADALETELDALAAAEGV